MKKINYNHNQNIHNEDAAKLLLPMMLPCGLSVSSILDVGAGTGAWINAAREIDIKDCVGIDGIVLTGHNLKCEPGLISEINLANSFYLGRRFDIAICLEVVEHLPATSARGLIESIVKHTDLFFFSAAIPGQNGQHHINCQWPEYWQNLINQYGFECVDDIRPRIWTMDVDPWYKQNMFRAFKSVNAGLEPRIRSLVHPEMIKHIKISNEGKKSFFQKVVNKLEKITGFQN